MAIAFGISATEPTFYYYVIRVRSYSRKAIGHFKDYLICA